ncbi:MAG TPA: hypothetical protein VFU05_15925 [Cyclobacteriaceae bacterium]|nr:hypothetical protein [Cyclobacteriaceae bacterium]
MSVAQTTNKNEVRIFILSLALITYFGFLFLNAYVLKLEYTAIRVFQEILTIPMIISAPVLLVFAIRMFLTNGKRPASYAFFTMLLLVSLIAITWGSFFV